MRTYLNALYQDILLQFYRVFFIVSQCIFLTIGCTTLFNNFLLEGKSSNLLIFSFHLVLSLFSISIALFIFNRIKKRKEDVDYWHKRILAMEEKGSSEREFYNFKKWQYSKKTREDSKSEVPIDILVDRKNKKIQLSTMLLVSIIFVWISLLIISFQIHIIA